MKALNSEYEPKERKDYLPKWPGFSGAFNLHMRGATKPCHIELDDRLEGEMRDSASPHVVLAARLISSLQTLETRRDEFDVIFLYRAGDLVVGFLRRN